MSVSTGAAALANVDVSRETIERLTLLHDLTLKWNQRVNLISRASESHIWDRHIADSAQLWTLAGASGHHWVDLGSGAGYPGLVIAALAAEHDGAARVTLVESDTRKAVFLSEAARHMSLQVTVLAQRIEALAPLEADVLSARALAPLDRLLGFTEKHRASGGMGLFPKGATVHKEVESAAVDWRFDYRLHRSVTDPGAAIVEVGALSRV